MTRKEFDSFVKRFRAETVAFMKIATPVRTGFMMNTSKEYDLPNGFGILWDAPYTVYTVEPRISPRWKIKPNPRERWILNALEQRLGLITQGVIK